MSKRNWKLLIEDIVESIEKIENYIKGMNFDNFENDSKTKDAVVRNLEIIGEAAGKLPKEICLKYDDIPWHQISGLRNRLIHGYFVIDYEIVWYIISKELDDLKLKLERILREAK